MSFILGTLIRKDDCAATLVFCPPAPRLDPSGYMRPAPGGTPTDEEHTAHRLDYHQPTPGGTPTDEENTAHRLDYHQPTPGGTPTVFSLYIIMYIYII